MELSSMGRAALLGAILLALAACQGSTATGPEASATAGATATAVEAPAPDVAPAALPVPAEETVATSAESTDGATAAAWPRTCFSKTAEVVLDGEFVKSGNEHCLLFDGGTNATTGTYCTEDPNYRGCREVTLSWSDSSVTADLGGVNDLKIQNLKADVKVTFRGVDVTKSTHTSSTEVGDWGFGRGRQTWSADAKPLEG